MHTFLVNNIRPVNFKANKIATIKPLVSGKTFAVDFYEVNASDNKFLKKLEQSINFRELLPNMEKSMQKRWQQVFDYCLDLAQSKDYKAVVAVCKEKVCGILTYINDAKTCKIEGICAIPDKDGHKVPLLGKMFFLNLFRTENENVKNYRLAAVTDGPFDVISKYKQLGFKEENTINGKLSNNETEHIYSQMSCNKYTAKDKLKELMQQFSIKSDAEAEQTDLSGYLD